jgi:NADH-quinone oxidoreductase subunit L
VDNAIHNFLEPTFRDSRYAHLETSTGSEWLGLIIGTLVGLAGIFTAYRLWIVAPERPRAIQARFSALHTFFVNKWYFDEAIDFLIVRPGAWLGRFAASTFERVFVNGALVGGSSGAIRALSAAVRGLQSGYLRYYAALLLVGLTGLSFYFLVSA